MLLLTYVYIVSALNSMCSIFKLIQVNVINYIKCFTYIFKIIKRESHSMPWLALKTNLFTKKTKIFKNYLNKNFKNDVGLTAEYWKDGFCSPFKFVFSLNYMLWFTLLSISPIEINIFIWKKQKFNVSSINLKHIFLQWLSPYFTEIMDCFFYTHSKYYTKR